MNVRKRVVVQRVVKIEKDRAGACSLNLRGKYQFDFGK